MARVLRGPRQQPVLLNFGAPIAMAISNIASAASSGPYRGVEVTSPGRILTLSLVSCSSLSQLPATNWRPLLLPLPFGLASRSEEHTSELQSLRHLVCRLLLEKKKSK